MAGLGSGAVALLGIVLLIVLLALRMPVAFAMALVGILGFGLLAGREAASAIAGIVPFTTSQNIVLTAVPMFILMGEFCNYSGMSGELYSMAHKWVGHFRGGLAQATIFACAIFSAVTGSSVACAATIGEVALPEMRKYGYSSKLATGTVCAGGTLGILIPPSTVFILYGLITETSIGKLFIAGIIPGIIVVIFYGVLIYVRVKLNPNLGPSTAPSLWKERILALRGIWAVLLLFILVIGGLYAGVFTATEAAAVGAFGSFLIAISRKKLTRQHLMASLMSTAKTTSMVLTIIIGAYMFGYYLAITKLPQGLAEWVAGLGLSAYAILVLVLFMYLILGCLLDAAAMMVLTLPVIFPLIVRLGFDPIWFGVILVRMVEIGLMTPPFAINVFVIRGVAKDVPMSEIYRGCIPFVLTDLLNVAVLVAFPQLTLFLPTLMKGN